MTDTLVRAVTTDGNFRAIAIDATEMMAEVSKFHEASQLGTTVLGRALLGSLMVSNAILKGDERWSLMVMALLAKLSWKHQLKVRYAVT